LDISRFEYQYLEYFLVIFITFPEEAFLVSCIIRNGKLAAHFTQKQQENEHEEINTCLQRLDGSGSDWERSCSIGRGVHAVLQPYYPVLQGRKHQARQRTF
jgi:hypothetical protein